VTFDTSWNLLAFGFNGKDYNAGTQDAWTTGTATDITAQGRPPFNSAGTTCYLSQFANAIYVLNADSANPSSIYIYDATAKSWSTQQVDAGKFDPSNFVAILDHDTNVFYAYSNSEIFSLDMSLLKSSTPKPLPWNDVQSPDMTAFTPDAPTSSSQTPGANTAGYKPVMALAQNHVHFLGVPGLKEGQAKIFVIHFSFMQPAPQSYGTPAFPSTHGKTASFFMPEGKGVQQEFAFIPDDGSATYVINVATNTTKTLTGPPQKDPFASYSASTSALVMLGTQGQVVYLPYDKDGSAGGGTWSTITKIPTASFSSASSSGSGGSSSSGSNSSTTTGGQISKPNSNNTGGALGVVASVKMQALWSVALGLGGALAVMGVVV